MRESAETISPENSCASFIASADLPAALLVETVQVEGGVHIASETWLQGLQHLCKEFGILLVVWLLSGVGSLLGDTLPGQIVSYLSFMEHYDRLVRGLIDTKDLVYFFSGLALLLFLTHRIVETARWK